MPPPSGDRDGDGIPDDRDPCPDEAEQWNGYQDDDGCPDRAIDYVYTDEPLLGAALRFPRELASLSASDGPVLDRLAALLANEKELVLVEVQGHASADEGDALALSSRRARAVRAALVTRGVAPERLEARGYGDTQPTLAGPVRCRTPRCDAADRRVEVRVLRHGP